MKRWPISADPSNSNPHLLLPGLISANTSSTAATWTKLGCNVKRRSVWTRTGPPYTITSATLTAGRHATPRLVRPTWRRLRAWIPDFAHSGFATNLWSAVLGEEGLFGEAIPWLKQALELAPDNPSYWEHLAELHAERDEHLQAAECWGRVLRLGSDRAHAHNGLGWALQEEGRSVEAEEHFRTALRLDPEHPASHLNLGGLLEEQGELAEAETCFRTAINLRPEQAMSYARLATMLRGKVPGVDRAALEDRAGDPCLGDAPKSHLLFALAHVCDGQGDFARAADCLRQANALQRKVSMARHRDYPVTDHEQFVDRLLAVFSREFIDKWRGAGYDSRRPVFVFGLPRSGTTLVEQVLREELTTARILNGAGELRLVRQLFDAIPAAAGMTGPPLDCVAGLNQSSIHALAGDHLRRLSELDGNRSDRVVDKMPDNYLYLGLISVLFPNAVLIHCRRDLRDVAVSCWMTDFRSIRWANDIGHIDSRFRQYRRVMAHWRGTVTFHDVHYESMVSDQEETTRALLSACGLEWDARCLEFHQTRRPVRTASLTQVRQPIYRQYVARWKNYHEELADLFDLVGNDF